MKKYRLSTTISKKHWDILKKHQENHKTHQKVLELALESLETNSNPQYSSAMSPEEELQSRVISELKYDCLIPKEGFKALLGMVDLERFTDYLARKKWVEFIIEIYYMRPLKECSLEEIMDGMIIAAKMCNWFDSIKYTEHGDHYQLIISHSLGLNGSMTTKLMNESMFKTYGIRTESQISERNVFMKIFKES